MFRLPSTEVGEVTVLQLGDGGAFDASFKPIAEAFTLLAETFGRSLKDEALRRIQLPVLSADDKWLVTVMRSTGEIAAWWYYNSAEERWFWMLPGSGFVMSSKIQLSGTAGTVPSSEFRFPVNDLHAMIQTVKEASQSKNKRLHECIAELSSRKGWIVCHGVGKYSLKFDVS
jgi:hypothetical protein